MGITLFEHNQRAYASAIRMLTDSGRAAIIHPTGTGKSFIGFKLCEEHPNEVICWLSPSEYIFQTQLENLRAVSEGYSPDNIVFFTYARLMNMSEEEMGMIKPDYIILDEFHRCGAEMWGQGVQRLLSLYRNIPIMGLTATAIRYLDNQRNMAEELFGGHVASEMTLGEAIVCGILKPPKYVLSVYAYEQDLKKYQNKVRRAKCRAVRDEAETYLEALRRALEKADGVDKIFEKHMTDRQGKYIVFCANAEHMRNMIDKVPAWFSGIDKFPHVYSAYSNDPETDRAFADFKADDSAHLKLLFCIDMLNEGVHVEGVAGVILFRPTVSPVVYKQQIGRALSASGTREPVIFDIVNNIENLYSIGTVQQEMQVAVNYYRCLGLEKDVVNEHFLLVDEVRDCRELFTSLQETLGASWMLMYSQAENYYKTYGHLEVPRRYKTADGYSLGNWIFTQRKIRSGEQYGKLDERRIELLDRIGMVWDGVRDLRWNRFFAAAQAYAAEHGNLDVGVNTVTDDGIPLGKWLCQLRSYRKSGIQTAYLTPERIEALDKLGMIWRVPDYLWESKFAEALAYYQSHGHLNIPTDYVSATGSRLGVWVANQRSKRAEPSKYVGTELTESQIARLDEIGMVWDKKSQQQWENGYAEAELYHATHGNLDVPVEYISPNGFRLGKWLSRQRTTDASKLSADRKEKLTAIGMKWNDGDPWILRYRLARDYFDTHGDLNVPADHVVNGIWLNKWLNEQKQIYLGKRDNKSLTEQQIKLLEEIGMQWLNPSETAWNIQFEEARHYFEMNGNLQVSCGYIGRNGKRLDIWVQKQRAKFRKGLLSDDQIERLTCIGFA